MFNSLFKWRRPDPFAAEMAAFRAADEQSPPPSGAVLFAGSSSIRMWDRLDQDMAPIPVINRGFGGSSIADVNKHFKTVAAPYAPRALVFYAGDNDLDSGRSAGQVIADFMRFMKLKQRRFGGAPVCFVSIKPAPARAHIKEARDSVNAAIRDLGRVRTDLIYIDIEAPMLACDRIQSLFLEDGVHLSAAGYDIWRAAIRPVLEALPA